LQVSVNKRVLILTSTGFGGKTMDLYVTALIDGLKKGGINSGDIYVEYLDLSRSKSETQRQLLAQFLKEKYAALKLDLVFCIQQPALNFLLKEGLEIAPHATIFTKGGEAPSGAQIGQRRYVIQTPQLDYAGTMRRALELFPGTKRVVIVRGSSELEIERQKEIVAAMAEWQGKLEIEDTLALSFAEIKEKLSHLPKDSIIFSVGLTRDAKGDFFVPSVSIQDLTRIAKAPFFVFYDSFIGSGAIGGMVSRVDEDARSLSEMAVNVLNGSTLLSEPVTLASGTVVPMFDWQQLQKWKANISDLPEGSVFINHPVSPWNQYAIYFIGVGFVILLLSGFVIALIFQNRQRRMAETRNRILIEQAPEAILVVDFETKFIIEANPSAEKLLRCTREDLLDHSIHKLYAEQQPDGLPIEQTRADNVERALAGESVLVQRAMRAFDGCELQCELRLVKLPDVRRKLLRVSLVDVTKRKQAEEQVIQLNHRLQALLDAAQEIAIISTDAEGHITVFNQGAEKMLGYTEAELIGKTPSRFHVAEEIQRRGTQMSAQLGLPIHGFEAFVALTRGGASDIQTWTYIRKDGQRLQVSLAVSAVHDASGKINGFLGIAVDISKQLAAEAELIQLNQQLDQRVQERTHALQTSTEQLQQALDNLCQMQDKLVQSEKLAALGSIVAAVAHELNTPIGNCMTVASTFNDKAIDFEKQVNGGQLRRSNLSDFMDDSRNAMQLLMRGLQRAVELVSNFKQVAVDQSSAQRRQFALQEVADSVIALMSASLQKKNYKTELCIPDTLQMDSYPGAIEQVIANLINNSVLHGFEGRTHGLIRIMAQADGDNIAIDYSDDGHGMSDEVISHIFDPFFTTRMGTGGSGLGMSICHNLIMGTLGGSIDVSSVQGHGCQFRIVLPCVAPQSKA
jgi:PAS domain S-box-containing protein